MLFSVIGLPNADSLFLILLAGQLTDVWNFEKLELGTNFFSRLLGQFVEIALSHDDDILKVVDEVFSLSEDTGQDKQTVVHELVVPVLRKLHQGKEHVLYVIEPVKYIPFLLGFDLLLLDGRELPHLVDPQVVVVKHVWLLLVLELSH